VSGEGVDDAQAGERPVGLQVFGQQDLAARVAGGLDDQRVPARRRVQPVKVDRAQHEVQVDLDDLERGEPLQLAPGDGRVGVELAGGDRVLLLQDRGADHPLAVLDRLDALVDGQGDVHETSVCTGHVRTARVSTSPLRERRVRREGPGVDRQAGDPTAVRESTCSSRAGPSCCSAKHCTVPGSAIQRSSTARRGVEAAGLGPMPPSLTAGPA
jgi:hypothetical protein